MALLPSNPMPQASSLLEVAQAQYYGAKTNQQKQDTAEFVALSESRRRQKRAENLEKAQTSEINTEIEGKMHDEGRIETLQRESYKKGTAQAEHDTEAANRGRKYEEVMQIVDDDTYEQAVAKRIQRGESYDDVKGELGPSYNKNWIKSLQDNYAQRAEDITKREEIAQRYSSDAIQQQTARMRAAVDLQIAAEQRAGRQAQARATMASNQMLDFDSIAAVPNAEHFGAVVATVSDKNVKGPDFKFQTQAVFAAYRGLLNKDIQRANQLRAAGIPVPPELDPVNLDRIRQTQAMIIALGDQGDHPQRAQYDAEGQAIYDSAIGMMEDVNSPAIKMWERVPHLNKEQFLNYYVQWKQKNGGMAGG